MNRSKHNKVTVHNTLTHCTHNITSHQTIQCNVQYLTCIEKLMGGYQPASSTTAIEAKIKENKQWKTKPVSTVWTTGKSATKRHEHQYHALCV